MKTLCYCTGINKYNAGIPSLRSCVADADADAGLAARAGLTVRTFFDDRVSLETYVGAYRIAAEQLEAGDVFVASTSQHGTEVELDDGTQDEALVFPDGSLLTGKARGQLLAGFRRDVLIVLFDHVCFAAGTIRGIDEAPAPGWIRRVAHSDIQPAENALLIRPREIEQEVVASVTQFADCRKTESASEDDEFGYVVRATHSRFVPGIKWGEWFNLASADVTARNPWQHPVVTESGSRRILDRTAWTF